MWSGRTMCRTRLWLLSSLAFFFSTSLAHGSDMKVMSAPNVLRIGTTENIFVECQDCADENELRVEISVMKYPTKSEQLANTFVNLNRMNKFQSFGQIKIPDRDFYKDPSVNQYVFLQAKFPDVELEKVVLVSFQFGYIFIQTDKTLYIPNSKVHYRIFALTPDMQPVQRDNETQLDASIVINIVTPEGVILPLDPVSVKSGVYSGDYQLGEIVSPGLWKVVAKFYSKPQISFSAEFEVKEYVLPSFEVKLMTKNSFFYVDSEELTINIKATYLFGEEVDGSAFGVFGVMHEDQKRSFPGSLQRVPIVKGEGSITLKKEHITQAVQNILDLVGTSLFVAVSVLTESGNEMAEAELRNIQIVTSPYTIHFKKTPKYFKPGMSFDLAIEVVNPDGTPAQGVVVVMNVDNVQGITAANGMARLSINTVNDPAPLKITATTSDPNISPERQASASMTALPYKSNNNNYMHIGVDMPEVTIGDNLKINLNLVRQENTENDITYLILSRGRLVKFGNYRMKGQLLISMIVPITKHMLPSFRIIAYYHTTQNEVVSDSIWVDVKDSCMGSLKLESKSRSTLYEPRKMFELKITGDPEATVGLVAVDKGVYILNNKHRLSQKKIWDAVENYDTGCTPGGGKDSMSVFYDAGLVFESNTASGTPYRQELKCPTVSRRKRDTAIMNLTSSLVSQYEDEVQRDCCLDGMRDTPVAYDCERRSEYILDGAACIEAFLHCCKEMKTQRAEKREGKLQLARSEEDDNSYMDSNEIVSRTKFPESWLWSEIKLPACTKYNCDSTMLIRNVPLQDSITTWQFTGISLSRTMGICVADPLEIIVRKEFFIDLRLPYSAVRGEQIEIKAILHNYQSDPATVRVDLTEMEHICSSASKRGKYRQEVNVGAKATRSVPFVIIPTRDGQYRIEVKASVKDSSLSDGIVKMLLVVPEGLLIKSPQIVTLDPEKKGVDGKQVETINSRIPKKDLLPNTPTSTQISVTGTEYALELKNEIAGPSMVDLVYQPSGCGEENMIHMTRFVITTTYLDKANKWEPVHIRKRSEALRHIYTGYQNQLNYRKKDGSFAAGSTHQSSTWLTAYVVKVFAMANSLVPVQSEVICDAVTFLIHNAQQPNGMFGELGGVSYREMTGDVFGTDSDASMTAFCLIAMEESHTLCAATVDRLPESIDKARSYLRKRLSTLINPYAIAMASYALASENNLNQEILYKFISVFSSDLSHWPVPGGRAYTLEATAYTLLALVKAKVRLFHYFGTYLGSDRFLFPLQATLIVYQAVAAYWSSAKGPEYDLNVDILLPGRSKAVKYNFNSNNPYATRTSKASDINQDVTVTATGKGEATLTMVSLYYALPIEKESDCLKFNMSVALIPGNTVYKDEERDATMSVLDIGFLTGFTINTKDLDLLSKGRARTIAKYKMNTIESERGSLIIYLDKVSHRRPEEISFRIHQKLKVGVLQPAAVSVYEYNNHEQNCVKFYHPERRAGELLQLCRNDECTCAEENCSMQKKGKINNDERTDKACETEVNKFTDGLSTDIYSVRVLEAIKEGSLDVGPQGKLRTFLSYPHCRVALDLSTGKTYLIMGRSKDVYPDDQSQTYRYVLGERTWIEYWPTDTECQTQKHNVTCSGIEEMVQKYTLYGCRN
uniref:Complement component c3a, duplicate 5 n=1 Tax=Anabas testudineus TaxID=64144 RepID=A0A3Q1IW90_ANATE